MLRELREITYRLDWWTRSASAASGMAAAHAQCLRVIADADARDMTVSRVAASTHLARSTVSAVADQLAKEGLILRERSIRDRRRANLTLTELGRRRVAQLPDPLEELLLARLRERSISEQQAMLAVLELVSTMLSTSTATPAAMPEGRACVSGPD